MNFDPRDNPLKDVKVNMESDFDPNRVIYRLWNGTDRGYRKAAKLNSLKQNQKNRYDLSN